MKHEATIYLAIDGDGGEAVSLESANEALDLLREDSESEAHRVVRLTVRIPLPELADVEVDVPETGDEPVTAAVEEEAQAA